ncbi:MAG: translocation/assembly module TamB domain-containing protein, partial [Gammaproteobacteria bacterium]
GDWSGSCSRLALGTPEGLPDWQLDRVLRLDWLAAERLFSIEPFCLRSGETTACSTGRVRVSPKGIEGVALRSDALPVELLPALLPPEVSASGTLALAVEASRRGTEPLQLQASVSSPLLRFEALAAGEEVPIELRDTAISLRRSGEAIRLEGSALTGPEGRIDMTLEAAGALPASALSGRIALRDVDTGPVLRLLPGSLEAGGRLGGEVRVGGSVGAPSLSGELAIGGGRFAHEALPQAIDDFSLALRFTGADATFDGQLRTRAGTGDIDGALRWAGEDWSANLRLRADDLLLEPRRGTRIHVAPDIRVELGPALARIGGTVRIPRADVDLEALPGNAVSASRDTVIVGAAPVEPGIDYALAIDLLPGAHVQLRGFGADARLGGALRLLREPGEALEGQGELRILDGRYTAYGQRLEVTEGSL